MNFLKLIIFSGAVVFGANANARVSPAYFCFGNIQVDVEQDDAGTYYLRPWKNYPTKYIQEPVRYQTIRARAQSGLIIEAGRLVEVIVKRVREDRYLGDLKTYSFSFNKRANYLTVKNSKGTLYRCSDQANDSAIDIEHED